DADAVVFGVGDDGAAAAGVDGDAGGGARGADAEAGRVAERDGRGGFGEAAGGVAGEGVDVVVDAAGDVEGVAAGGPGQADEGVGDLHDLLLARRVGGDVEDEDVLVRFGGDAAAVGAVVAVVAAGEDQERVAVGSDGGG